MFENVMSAVIIGMFILGVRACITSEVSEARLEERTNCKCEKIENRSEYSTCVEEIKKSLKEEK